MNKKDLRLTIALMAQEIRLLRAGCEKFRYDYESEAGRNATLTAVITKGKAENESLCGMLNDARAGITNITRINGELNARIGELETELAQAKKPRKAK